VRPLSSSSYLLLLKVIQYLHTFSFSSCHPFRLSSIMLVRRHFHVQDVNNPLSLPSFFVCRMFLSSLALCSTAYHILKLLGYLCSTFLSVQFSAPYRAMLHIWQFTGFFLQFKSSLQVRRVFLLNVTLSVAVLDLISHVHLCSFIIRLDETFPIFQLLLISCNLYVGMGVVVLRFSLSHLHIHFHSLVSSNFN